MGYPPEYKGDVGQNDLTNVGSSYGYSYAEGDGSGLNGPFVSFLCSPSAIQIKGDHGSGCIKVRTKNLSGHWNAWKVII